VVDGLNSMGWSIKKPQGTFYIWAPAPEGMDGETFAARLIEEANVVVTPGLNFGKTDEAKNYFRISFTINDKRLEEALERISKIKF
jgi:LL-diaminopimelate aminotransferase